MGSILPPEPHTLVELLSQAAGSSHDMTIYKAGEGRACVRIPYSELFEKARLKARQLASLLKDRHEPILFLHLATFQENVQWFWACVMAGILPAVSTALPPDVDRRRTHLTHIRDVLKQPLVLVSKELVKDFDGMKTFDLEIVEDLTTTESIENQNFAYSRPEPSEPVVLMLTSGSSGNSKAVVLRHEQIIASVRGKSAYFETTASDVFLNWIGFDHVASMVETHIHALYLGAEFVHVPAATVLADPARFLQLVSEHRVTYTFAPHFFLDRLLPLSTDIKEHAGELNLSCLRRLISGGEANNVDTVLMLAKALKDQGFGEDVITPGFGMTETCAGSIYSKVCPSHDTRKGYAFASVGKPIPGMRMRIVNDAGTSVTGDEVGDLQVKGEQVFRGYFNNASATTTAFTADGWFSTGDRAFVDADGNLSIAGREQESINLNGVKHFPNDIESSLDNAKIEGLTPSWTVVFSCRLGSSPSEELCIVYLPTYDFNDVTRRAQTAKALTNLVSKLTFTRPKHTIPLPERLLHKSALGKLPRTKIKIAFQKGEYEQYEDSKNVGVVQAMAQQIEKAKTRTERVVSRVVREVANIPEEFLDIRSSVFELGISSIDLFALKKQVEKDLALPAAIPVGVFLNTPTIRGIAEQLERLGQQTETEDEYNPVVPLHSNAASTKPPLWLIHPGSGDVLIFVALARYFPDRNVYGIRTKGLNTGIEDKSYFKSIAEHADCYVEHIRKHQPNGPYAIAGYSLGSSVAFEVAKRLESMDCKVPFLGLLDSPPDMRSLIAKLDWFDVLLNVAYFLELISEEDSNSVVAKLRQGSSDEALEYIIASAPKDRLEALAIDKARLHKIANVTNAFREAGRMYGPKGSVAAADIFWVTPLMSVASGRKEWMEKHLSHWNDFVREKPQFHECHGTHSMMLNTEFVDPFQKIMRAAMMARGV